MKQKRLQAIDSAAVGRANARVAVNAFERSSQDFMNKKVGRTNQKNAAFLDKQEPVSKLEF
jgi:hypothetical protein